MKRAVAHFLFVSVLALPILTIKAEGDAEKELRKAQEAMQDSDKGGGMIITAPSKGPASHTVAEAFVAGPDWEFDGFVSGGQDSQIKSMYVINDLVYLNLGEEQGIRPGTILSIYRKGAKVRDAKNGKFLGFEVRRAAISEVTDKVSDRVSAARIIQTYEGVEIGDLVRIDR